MGKTSCPFFTRKATIADNLIICFSWHLLASANYKDNNHKDNIWHIVFPISLAVWHLEKSLKLEVSCPVNFFPHVLPHIRATAILKTCDPNILQANISQFPVVSLSRVSVQEPLHGWYANHRPSMLWEKANAYAAHIDCGWQKVYMRGAGAAPQMQSPFVSNKKMIYLL